jgi:hypothetical protein
MNQLYLCRFLDIMPLKYFFLHFHKSLTTTFLSKSTPLSITENFSTFLRFSSQKV